AVVLPASTTQTAMAAKFATASFKRDVFVLRDHIKPTSRVTSFHLVGYFSISPVFMDHRTRSNSSKSIAISRAKRFKVSSNSRYRLLVVGGLGVSTTPTSERQRTTCLSRIA